LPTLNEKGTKKQRDMPTRIRLQRKGKKGRPFYHLVVADQRSPRDGKYIERIGAYDPNRNPALVEVDSAKALDWLQKGAQPSDTARAILSYTGVVYKNHLQNGVKKGAFDQAEADRRFEAWMGEKKNKVEAKRTNLADTASKAYKDRVTAETKKAQDMAAALTAKLAAAAAPAAEAAPEAPAEGEANSDAAPEQA
jgi:small subunit ribosomal protein S16